MSRARLLVVRARVRAREERYYRMWRRYSKKGKKPLSPAARSKNRERRVWYLHHYQDSRKRRRALDARISRLPIRQVDRAGEEFIIAQEGVVLHPYNDSRGLATIGVGHLIGMRGVTDADRRRYAGFDRDDAMVLLARDLDKYEAAVADSFGARGALTATQNRFNALTSFCFNIGTGGYSSSTAARGVRTGSAKLTIEGMRMWKRPPEIGLRREREVSLFKKS